MESLQYLEPITQITLNSHGEMFDVKNIPALKEIDKIITLSAGSFAFAFSDSEALFSPGFVQCVPCIMKEWVHGVSAMAHIDNKAGGVNEFQVGSILEFPKGIITAKHLYAEKSGNLSASKILERRNDVATIEDTFIKTDGNRYSVLYIPKTNQIYVYSEVLRTLSLYEGLLELPVPDIVRFSIPRVRLQVQFSLMSGQSRNTVDEMRNKFQY